MDKEGKQLYLMADKKKLIIFNVVTMEERVIFRTNKSVADFKVL